MAFKACTEDSLFRALEFSSTEECILACAKQSKISKNGKVRYS